jgi:hypothetical protein
MKQHADTIAPLNPPKISPLMDCFCEGSENKNKKISTKIQAILRKTKMHWLVPACSRNDLIKTVALAGDRLFPARIAGLVPGGTNSPLDAYAYGWAKNAPLEWSFEFKARSASYGLTKAKTDLEEKCKKIATNCHAMLVGVASAGPTKLSVWLDRRKLRIVLLVSSASGA